MTSELRPALEVWDLLWDAFTGTPPQSGNPNAPFEAAAAVIQAYGDEREAKARAEQAAELAKFKALAETLAGALDKLHEAYCADDYGTSEGRAFGRTALIETRKALREYKEARDAE